MLFYVASEYWLLFPVHLALTQLNHCITKFCERPRKFQNLNCKRKYIFSVFFYHNKMGLLRWMFKTWRRKYLCDTLLIIVLVKSHLQKFTYFKLELDFWSFVKNFEVNCFISNSWECRGLFHANAAMKLFIRTSNTTIKLKGSVTRCA